jgi:hypothetical protein
LGKGQKELQKTATEQSKQDLVTAKAASDRLINNPQLKALEERTAADRTAIDNGTFQNSSRFSSNRDAVAQRIAQRNGSMSLARTGFGALGARYADPNQLAQQDNILRDENARDIALQAEEDARTFKNQTYLNEDNLINKRVGIDSGIMATAYGQSNYNFSQAAQIASQRASILPGILGAAISGAATVGSAYLKG